MLRERIEGDGREILYLLQRRGAGFACVVLAGAYLWLAGPSIGLWSSSPSYVPGGAGVVAAASVLAAAMAASLCFVLRSSVITLVVTMMIDVMALYGLIVRVQQGELAGGAVALALLGIAAVCFAFAEWASRRFIA